MKRALLTAAICVAASGQNWAPAFAQSATSTGIGVGIATSKSESNAVAISGQGGKALATGGVGVGVANGGAIAPSASITQQAADPNQSLKNVPSVFAPGLAAAGLETCLGSISGGGSWLGTGISLGGTLPDPGCQARLDARTLWSMGLKKAAVARLCLIADVYRSMPDVCVTYMPPTYVAPVGGYVEQPVGPVPYHGGDIWLVDGMTGKDRLCRDWNSARKRCRIWADIAHQSSSKLKSDATPPVAPAAFHPKG